jgi:hypothetical protein
MRDAGCFRDMEKQPQIDEIEARREHLPSPYSKPRRGRSKLSFAVGQIKPDEHHCAANSARSLPPT